MRLCDVLRQDLNARYGCWQYSASQRVIQRTYNSLDLLTSFKKYLKYFSQTHEGVRILISVSQPCARKIHLTCSETALLANRFQDPAWGGGNISRHTWSLDLIRLKPFRL